MNYQATLSRINRPFAIEWKSLLGEVRARYTEQTGKSGRITETRENGTASYKIGGKTVIHLESNNIVLLDRSMISLNTALKLGVA